MSDNTDSNCSFASILGSASEHGNFPQTQGVSIHGGMLYLQNKIKQVINQSMWQSRIIFFSSSSRFTDSSKYEDTFRGCFNLGEDRVGEICNACVLLVKRWKKLPKNTKRNWSHVVDARAGPGAKNFVKQKKKEETGEEFEKIRRKHFIKKCPKPSPEEEEGFVTTPDNLESASLRLRENKIGDFFDSYYWKRSGCFYCPKIGII